MINFLLIKVLIKVTAIIFFIHLTFPIITFPIVIHINFLSYLYPNFNFSFIIFFHYDIILHFIKLMIHLILLIIDLIEMKNYHNG